MFFLTEVRAGEDAVEAADEGRLVRVRALCPACRHVSTPRVARVCRVCGTRAAPCTWVVGGSPAPPAAVLKGLYVISASQSILVYSSISPLAKRTVPQAVAPRHLASRDLVDGQPVDDHPLAAAALD